MVPLAEPLRVFARAKINLFLHVGDKGADGYHALESLVVFADAGDTLLFEPDDTLSLALDGPFAQGLEAESDNLILRAARALARRAGVAPQAHIDLVKNLPVASGIGGGSADAAAALHGLRKLWEIDIAETDLQAIAETLGSDVPVCLASRAAWMEGRGERVTPVADIPELPALLVNPGVAVPTGPVFAALKERRGIGGAKPGGWMSAGDLVGWLGRTSNDLEAPARAIAPEVGTVLDSLRACHNLGLARMSGSGATCFGLFTDQRAVDTAEARIRAHHPDWWVVATTLG